MARRTISVKLYNPSSNTVRVYVGATALLGIPQGSGCNLNVGGNVYIDIPPREVVIDPGKTVDVVFNYDDTQIIRASGARCGQQYIESAIVKVWRNYNPDTGELSGCIAGAYASATLTVPHQTTNVFRIYFKPETFSFSRVGQTVYGTLYMEVFKGCPDTYVRINTPRIETYAPVSVNINFNGAYVNGDGSFEVTTLSYPVSVTLNSNVLYGIPSREFAAIVDVIFTYNIYVPGQPVYTFPFHSGFLVYYSEK